MEQITANSIIKGQITDAMLEAELKIQEPGLKLRGARERLGLTYRDVEQASQRIANFHGNYEYTVGLSRLADIENKGTVPSIYRLYSLCAIYRLRFAEALDWYGVDLDSLAIDASHSNLSRTHTFDMPISERMNVDIPVGLEDVDLRRTSFLSRHINRWGKIPLALLSSPEIRKHRYAFIGTEDWFMHPVIPPGSFIQIDTSKHRIVKEGWMSERERPIYFLEHRGGFQCGWCSQQSGFLFVHGHPTSAAPPSVYAIPGEAEILGQVVGVAMRLDLGKRRHTHS